jgi:hypothetical protein
LADLRLLVDETGGRNHDYKIPGAFVIISGETLTVEFTIAL